MSQWNNVEKEDMALDGDEINIYAGYNDQGSIYAVVKISDMLEKLDAISKQSLLTWIEQRMKRTSKKKGLRAEENRNGYNQALNDLKQFINETKKETND